MVEIEVTHDTLTLEVLGSHKFWALKSRLSIPLEHIKGVYADPEPAMGWFQGLKVAGADIPHIFRAGMFYQKGEKVFWDVRHPKNTIVIETEYETFSKLIVEVKDPSEAVAEIRRALEDYRASKEEAIRELDQFLQSGGVLPESGAKQVKEDA